MLRIGFALGFALLAAACGGDDDVGSISGNKTMSELSLAEATALCREYQADFDAIFGLPCTIEGLSRGEGAACEAARDVCLETASSLDCDDVQLEDLDGCDIAVSTVEQCVAEFAGFARGVSCEEPPSSPLTPPPCFNDLRANCPLFGQ